MACPSEGELASLAQGELSPADAERVSAHAQGCVACRSLLSKLRGPEEARGAPAQTLPVLPDRAPGPGDEDDDEPLDRGAIVGRYDILQHLASGGMGAVYAAYDPQLDRRVALKVLSHRGRSEVSRERLQIRLMREAQAMARLTHPNVAAVHDVGTFQGRVFLAMEFVDGGTLKEWLKAEKRTWREVRDLFVQAGRGLAAAHAVGLIHRDFKPDNVLIGKDGRARVADFGLARPAHETRTDDSRLGGSRGEGNPDRTTSLEMPLLDTPLTQAGTIMGTPRYMAPEQIRAEPTDERTDQFSFAVALYEALYGVRPFAPKLLVERLQAIAGGQLQPPPAGHGVPEWMGQAVRRALAADPAQRFPTMDALLAALQQDARKGRANLLVAAAVVAVGSVAAAGAVALRPDLRCKGAEQRLQGAWDPDRRAAMHRAFAAFQDGEAQFGRTAGVLDDYGRRWTAMSEETCEATRVRGDQPESVMALRVACLDLRLHELQYLTALFASADQKLVDRGVDAASGLSSVRSCADAAALTQEVPLPEDAAARDAIRRVKEQLTEVNALMDAGLYKEALEKANAAVEKARALRYRPVEGEALFLQSWLLDHTGETARSIEVIQEAMLAADAGRADLLRARAASQAVYAAAEQKDFARGKAWAGLAQAALDRIGGNAERQGALLVHLAVLQIAEGQDTVAAGTLERGRQLLASELGHDDLQTLNASGNLAALYQRLGRLDEAVALFDETIATLRRRMGPDHPFLIPRLYGMALAQIERHDYGSAHRSIDEAIRITRARVGEDTVRMAGVLEIKATIFGEEHRYEEALATYRRALEIKQKALPMDDQRLSYSYDGIGQSLLGLGRPEEARPMLERALAIRGSFPEDLGDTQYGLARALWQLGQQKEAALGYAEQAMANYRRAGKAERATEVEGWLARRR